MSSLATYAELAAQVERVRKLHVAREIDALGCSYPCEAHEDDRDCPTVKLKVCAYCYDRADEIAGGYYGEEGIEACVLHPCPTIAALDGADQ